MACLIALALLASDASSATLETQHFQINYRNEAGTARHLAQICEPFYRDITAKLGRPAKDLRIKVWLVESEEQFHRIQAAPIQDWAVASAYPTQGAIVVQHPRALSTMKLNFDSIVKHEIIHVVFGQRALPSLDSVPRWFSEGLAMHYSEEWSMTHRWRLIGAGLWRRLFPLEGLRQSFPASQGDAWLAYTQSFSAVQYIADRGGPYALHSIVDILARGQSFDDALIQTVSMNLENFEEQWLSHARRLYHWGPILSSSFVFWGGISLIVVMVYLGRRRARRRVLEQWQAEETQIDPFFAEGPGDAQTGDMR